MDQVWQYHNQQRQNPHFAAVAPYQHRPHHHHFGVPPSTPFAFGPPQSQFPPPLPMNHIMMPMPHGNAFPPQQVSYGPATQTMHGARLGNPTNGATLGGPVGGSSVSVVVAVENKKKITDDERMQKVRKHIVKMVSRADVINKEDLDTKIKHIMANVKTSSLQAWHEKNTQNVTDVLKMHHKSAHPSTIANTLKRFQDANASHVVFRHGGEKRIYDEHVKELTTVYDIVLTSTKPEDGEKSNGAPEDEGVVV